MKDWEREMKNSNLLTTVVLLLSGMSCQKSISAPQTGLPTPVTRESTDADNQEERRMKITVGEKSFRVKLDDNPTVDRLRQLLPLTLKMTELNGNEKYFHLSDRLPTKASNPGTIRSGDLMLYGNNSLVLFYETFGTTYSYTRLGRLDEPSGLAEALGSGDVSVTFELE